MIGSSPHARGLPPGPQWHYHCRWIIPACAGFTHPRILICWGVEDHPRMRGVYMPFVYTVLMMKGSSPHAWGLLNEDRMSIDSRRIIPACAGFTWPLLGCL